MTKRYTLTPALTGRAGDWTMNSSVAPWHMIPDQGELFIVDSTGFCVCKAPNKAWAERAIEIRAKFIEQMQGLVGRSAEGA